MLRSERIVQGTLFDMPATPKVVNVASVPHRSPFRYPGGKTWLIPRIRQWIRNVGFRPSLLVEPFAGGAIVGLTAIFEHYVDRVKLVEIDPDVAAVWQTILSDDNEWLAMRILRFDVTDESVRAEIAKPPESRREQAFKTILRNRTFHGGILAHGAAPIRTGENGKGIRSRWYPGTIAQRIRNINNVRDRIEFVAGDGIAEICRHQNEAKALFFIDPPYTAAGKMAGSRLYNFHELDHRALFDSVNSVKGCFLMTYDMADEVVQLAQDNGFATQAIAMKNTHHAVMSEILISRNLEWLL